jgi:hypothetical protein
MEEISGGACISHVLEHGTAIEADSSKEKRKNRFSNRILKRRSIAQAALR